MKTYYSHELWVNVGKPSINLSTFIGTVVLTLKKRTSKEIMS